MVQVATRPGGALEVIPQLLLGARAWSTGRPVDLEGMAMLRRTLLRENHQRHLAAIPAYARLADELGIGPELVGADDGFLLSDGWFKGYDAAWPARDLPSLTAWLGEVSTVRPVHPEGVTDLATWRAALRGQDVFVTVSSGTAGPRSLVPRDRMTLTMLRSSSGVRLLWSRSPGTFDALLLTPRGMGSGIQSGASGIGSATRRSVHDEDPDVGELVDGAVAEGHPVVVYGSPARLARLLDRLPGGMALPPDSCVVTGGGWKAESGAGEVGGLLDRAAELLGVRRDRCVDTYSTAELNTVFVSCREHRYHVPPVMQATVVDDQLRPIDGDADGRLAVLDPMAMSYPGRLVTSDLVRLRHDPCRCGLPGQTLLPGFSRLVTATARGCGVTDRVGP